MTWVELTPATDVAVGEAIPVDVGELELVAWRGHDGIVCVMEARCPHLWSHLGVTGVVDGTEIVCAAHFWRFDRRGCGSKLAESGRRDLKSDVRVYPAREVDGLLSARLDTPRSADFVDSAD